MLPRQRERKRALQAEETPPEKAPRRKGCGTCKEQRGSVVSTGEGPG